MTKIANWSNTHNVTGLLYQPETLEELERLVRDCHERGMKLRPVGAGISPNGIAFEDQGMVNLSKMNNVLHVDEDTMQVRVQAGMRVSELVDALKPYGLTLPNYASIKEQEIGGFVSAGAHGTGAYIPPLDDTVVAMHLVTPARGGIEITRKEQPQLLDALKVGLGAFGVVAEVTLQCVKSHNLEEHTFTATRAQICANHEKWLKNNKHIRYMWLPYTDTVVVVTNNPTTKPPGVVGSELSDAEEERRLKPMHQLLTKGINQCDPETRENLGLDASLVGSLNFAEARDWLLKFNTLNTEHVRRANQAEAEFWKNSEGKVVGDSSEMLQFDCGGEQLVFEVCYPTGTVDNLTPAIERKGRKVKPPSADVGFVMDLLEHIETTGFPAPSPIEQRWTRASQSRMSPAASASINDVFSWVGVIMYLPVSDPTIRGRIQDKFRDYTQLVRKVGAELPSDIYPHWGKIEMPSDAKALEADQAWLSRRYPVGLFNSLRRELDPKNICANDLINKAFPLDRE
uniref:FAD-binding PCMH-type domain-containing protein n=1 Tax=Lotharella globosa TaxID=91324 RepID=A0A7S3Z880_9EUKA